MKKKTYFFVLFLVVALGLSLGYNYKQYRDLQEQPVKRVENTVVKYIEKKDSMPEPKTETVVKTIKIPVPAKSNGSDSIANGTGLALSPEANAPGTVADSLELEITQKVYSDSTYTAYVSGYMPQLDSIFVRQKIIEHSIIETRTVSTKKFRRWNVGVVGGYGYGFKNKSFEPFIGVGLTLSLF